MLNKINLIIIIIVTKVLTVISCNNVVKNLSFTNIDYNICIIMSFLMNSHYIQSIGWIISIYTGLLQQTSLILKSLQNDYLYFKNFI
jgi:hypothetical protein